MAGVEETRERARLLEYRDQRINWKLWGPYLSERQWGTVREDYSDNGDSWDYFTRDSARCRSYRWGEDGIAGISDDHQRLCFAIALWNRADDYLKERFFGLTNGEGNNGEDVKEYYYYLDNTPTHSYMKYLYKYPHGKFPCDELLNESLRRKGSGELWPEYELIDTGALLEGGKPSYFDVVVEYAKAGPDDILVRVTVKNRGDVARGLDLLPSIWFRNVWSWGDDGIERPRLWQEPGVAGMQTVRGEEFQLKERWLYCENASELVFTENESNRQALGWGGDGAGRYYKDGIDRYIRGESSAVNPAQTGTKAAAIYRLELAAGESGSVRLRLANAQLADPFADFDAVFQARKEEADDFYRSISPSGEADLCNIQRQAFAGMLWNKQLYFYIVRRWLDGDPNSPPPPDGHRYGRNSAWTHLYSKDILSMPDTWEYPWFAAWDLAFHTTTLAIIDPDFAKSQLLFLVMEWSMHPDGQLPAYEWDFSNVNPPVQAWAAWNVYQREKSMYGKGDLDFLRRVYSKLNMNFTWWVNKQDRFGNNIFEGGFLGMDNIRIMEPSDAGETIEQSDGTAWMAMYCLNMLEIGAELVNQGDVWYRDALRKYFQHFLYISVAINNIGGKGLWDDQEKFYFDVLRHQDGSTQPLKVFSLTGLIPLLAIGKIDVELIDSDSFLELRRTFSWFLENRADLTRHGDIYFYPPDADQATGNRFRITLAIVPPEKLKWMLARLLDSGQFLSDYGIRSLSKFHEANPYILNGREIRYEPGHSKEKIMGGNSNWRGPVWMPVNYLIIDALRRFHDYLDGQIRVEYTPDGGSPTEMNLRQVAEELSRRIIAIFRRNAGHKRPVFGNADFFDSDPDDPVLFYEYFHGDSGAGLGASHQTGWTGLVANLIDELKYW